MGKFMLYIAGIFQELKHPVIRESIIYGIPHNTILVGVFKPSEKYEFVNWDDDILNRWESKTCSKPPTSISIATQGLYWPESIEDVMWV